MTESTRTLATLELVGGALCLDFANTVNSRVAPEHDYLLSYSDLLGWAKRLGILSSAQSGQLQRRAKLEAEAAKSTLLASQTLRDLLYHLFSNAAKGSELDQKDREIFVVFYGESISRGRLIKAGNRYKTTWEMDESLESMLWPIIHSAGELLLSEELDQVKECPGCGWLFLDTSKNKSRRWCSMNTCGARDKMRRYHKRKRVN